MNHTESRAREIFLESLDQPPDQLVAFVQQACGDDDQVRKRVHALLQARNKAGGFLAASRQDEMSAQSGAALEQTAMHSTASMRVGETIGPYKLLEEIGEGGMGTVWVAEQSKPIKRKVAIKLIKPGMDSRQVLARFGAERQALAMMDHPNIARVLDGGITEQGRPYFAMEYVKGVPLTEYCDQARLSLKERLNLFMPVCQAVQHAHQKGIIHRDLKPSNILICLYDGKPVPKVIDFGLAKAMHQSLTEHSLHTAIGMMVGTPLYMSPEQAEHNNLDVDTRTDIYSLGVILYELLTGSTPLEKLQLKEAAFNEILRLIKEVEAPKPSTRLSSSLSLPSIAAQRSIEPNQLKKSLIGDLDWIVMKALDKERSRRYETANGLARDVERFLNDEAVEACPPSATYRLKKLVRRNRGAVLAVGAIAATLLLATVVSVWFAFGEAEQRRVAEKNQLVAEAERTKAEAAVQREAEQRTRAEKARDRTRDVLDAMTSSATGDSLSTQQEISPDQKKFLIEVLTYYKEYSGEKADDEPSRYRQAAAAIRVGAIEYRLGRLEEAATANNTAIQAFSTLVADFPAVSKYRQKLAQCENDLALLLAGMGKWEKAEAGYRKSVSIQETLAIEFPKEPAYKHEMARSRYNLANLLVGHQQWVGAESEHRKAQATFQELVGDYPDVPKYREELAQSAGGLGTLLAGIERWTDAEEQFRKATMSFESLVADAPSIPRFRRGLALSRCNLGALLTESGKWSEAENEYRKALTDQEKLAADFPAVPTHRQELATSHNNLALLLADHANRIDAANELRLAISIREKLAADFPEVSNYRVQLGCSYGIYGTWISDEGKPEESLKWFDLAIGTLTPVYEKDSRNATANEYLRNSHSFRAQAYDRRNQFLDAVKDWDRAIELSPPAAQPELRASRATSRLQAGQVAEAVAEIFELTGPNANAGGSPNWGAGRWYDFACVYSVASGKVADKKQEYADRAMTLLQKAVDGGFNDTTHMKQDPDLDPLRERDDFKQLLVSLKQQQLPADKAKQP